MDSPACPICQDSEDVVRNGKNPSGSQKYKCRGCNYTFTPEPVENDPPPVKLAAQIADLERFLWELAATARQARHTLVPETMRSALDQIEKSIKERLR